MPYVLDLAGAGNAVIKSYVEKGGSFLGICAGAYYAGQEVEFDKGGHLEVTGNRELAFFPGTIRGPLFKQYDYKTNAGAQVARLDLDKATSYPLRVYYNGGGYFVAAQDHKNIQVIATYAQSSGHDAAIISRNYDKGVVVLSGVHFEYAPELLNPRDRYLKPIITELEEFSAGRISLSKNLLKVLRLDVK